MTGQANIQPIETIYKGYKFRSRLEARWAVFFDSLNLEYQYEPEGFALGDLGCYLPDFWLPGIRSGFWIEVKGTYGDCEGQSCEKLTKLCELTGKNGLLVWGDPYGNIEQHDSGPIGGVGWQFFSKDSWDLHHLFCVCPWCGKLGIEFEGRGARVCGWKAHHETEKAAGVALGHPNYWHGYDREHSSDDPKIHTAALKARQARFEHGENPLTRSRHITYRR